jgi:hypothetical protein
LDYQKFTWLLILKPVELFDAGVNYMFIVFQSSHPNPKELGMRGCLRIVSFEDRLAVNYSRSISAINLPTVHVLEIKRVVRDG